MIGQLDTFIAFAVVILGVSLLITVLNQAVVAVLSMRGANLRWGIQTLLEHIDSNLAPHATEISEAVLRHPLISDSTWSKERAWPLIGWFVSRWKLASTIRREELKEILEKLSTATPAAPWQAQLQKALASNRTGAEARLAAATAALNALSPAVHAQIDSVAPHVKHQFKKAAGDLDLWFDSVMDRVSQRFAANLRLWTVVWAVVVAFVLHLDSSRLLRQIQGDPQLRARLVASTESMTRHAERVLDAAVPNATGAALKRLHSESPDLKLKSPPDATSRAAARDWITQQKLSPERQAELEARLDILIRDETKEVLGDLRKTADGIEATLQAAGLQIVPDYSKHRSRTGWPDWWPFTEADSTATPPVEAGWNDHFFGVLFSAMLLSLGAPFWFNVLKSAATLRPVLANKEEGERQQRS